MRTLERTCRYIRRWSGGDISCVSCCRRSYASPFGQEELKSIFKEETATVDKFKGVADTLYIPLTARIYVSERFPEYFYDEKAVSLKNEIPYEAIASKSSEYFQMAGACRFYNTDRMIREFIGQHPTCNIVNIGCGLETSYFRLAPPEEVKFYENGPAGSHRSQKARPRGKQK